MPKNKRILELLAEFLPNAQAIELRGPARSSRVTLYALLALVLTAVVWASLSNIDKLVIGTGRLITPLSNLVVQPLEPGILKSINVRVGQVVRKGEILATLDPTFATSDASQLASRGSTLLLQSQRLESEFVGKSMIPKLGNGVQQQLQAKLLAERQSMYAARIRQFDESIQRLRAGLVTNKQDQTILARRMKSLQELEAMYKELEGQQFGTKSKRLEAEEQKLGVERDYLLALNKEQELHREIAVTEAERTTFTKTWQQDAMEKLSTTLQQRDEVNDQLAKARLRADLVTLTAPQDSVVLEIGKKSVGSVLKDAEPLFVLVPVDAKLELEIEVTPADIGELRMGDVVRIKVDAYPFQKHGTAVGKVTNISADTFSRQTAVGGQTYHYLVRASLEDTRLNHLPGQVRLLPGMTLTGEVITGKRTVISYFLYPVLRIFDESLRER